MEVVKEGIKTEVTPDTHVYIDPRNFTETDLPIAVLCDDLRSFVGWAIKAHGAGHYNHAFIIHKPGWCVSQDFTGFREKKIDVYLTDGMMLKFWQIKNITELEKGMIKKAILDRLALPWWRRSYDFLGTFVGQFFHLKFIQNPFQEFCSEEVRDDYIRPIPRLRALGRLEPNPSELNTDWSLNPLEIECKGYWWFD